MLPALVFIASSLRRTLVLFVSYQQAGISFEVSGISFEVSGISSQVSASSNNGVSRLLKIQVNGASIIFIP